MSSPRLSPPAGGADDRPPSANSSADPAPAGAATHSRGHLVIVMGVSACGKTTVGELVVQALQRGRSSEEAGRVRFVDADDYHSESSKQKMAAGTPLTDADRQPWLRQLADIGRQAIARGETCVMGCSALKHQYRRVIFGLEEEEPPGEVDQALAHAAHFLVHLKGSYQTLHDRITARKGHFAKENLLASQFQTLETPTEKECRDMDVRLLDVDLDQKETSQKQAEEIAAWLRENIGGQELEKCPKLADHE